MVKQLQLPDGRIVEFPEEATNAQMQEFLDSNFNQPQQQEQRQVQVTAEPGDEPASILAGIAAGLLPKPLQAPARAAIPSQRTVETVEDIGTGIVTGAAELPIGLGQRITAGLESAGVEGGGIAALGLAALANPREVLTNPQLREELLNTDIREFREAQANTARQLEELQRQAAETSPVAAPVGEFVGSAAPFAALGAPIRGIKSALGVGGAAGAGVGLITPTEDLLESRAEIEQSLGDAVKGGLIGAATAGTFQTILQGGGYGAKKLANILKNRTPESFTRAEKYVRDQLSALQSVDLTRKVNPKNPDEVAVSLAQAANAPELKNAANLLSRSGTGAIIAKESLDRTAKSLGRAENKILNSLSAEKLTPKQGADIMIEGLNNAKDDLIKARELKASPFYERAFKKQVSPKVEEELLLDPFLGQKFRQLQNDPLTQSSVDNISSNSLEMWNKVKRNIDDEIAVAKSPLAPQPDRARVLTQAKNKLKDALVKDNPTYGKALKEFADESEVVTELFGKGKKYTALGDLTRATDEGAVQATVKMLTRFEPETIRGIKDSFIRLGKEPQYNAGVKASLQRQLDNLRIPSGQTITDDAPRFSTLLNNKTKRQRISAAIGTERTKALESVLSAQDEFRDFTRALQGSQTAPLQVTQENITQAGKPVIQRGLLRSFKLLQKGRRLLQGGEPEVEEVLNVMGDERYLDELTRLLFDPEEGARLIKKINNASSKESKAAAISEMMDRAVKSVSTPITPAVIGGTAIGVGELE